jgi:hypothetical protein
VPSHHAVPQTNSAAGSASGASLVRLRVRYKEQNSAESAIVIPPKKPLFSTGELRCVPLRAG